MKKRTIDRWTWDYWLTQQYVKLFYRIFYKKIYVRNLENIPKNEAVILAPNHQNALMDALAIVCNTPFQAVFLARSDIFRGKFLIHFLNFLNIIPIYRIRDGIENVRKNDEVFNRTLQVFRNKYNPVCIFPEGNHGDRRKLRQLVKGIFRMAFQAQEDYEEKPGVKIVPVGIDYGHYSNFRTSILINVGEPIEVAEYYPQYTNDKAIAINELKNRLASEMSRLMIDIRNDEYYDLYMNIRMIYDSRMCDLMNIKDPSLYDKFVADKKIIGFLDLQFASGKPGLQSLKELTDEYVSGLLFTGLNDQIVSKQNFSFIAEFLKLFLLVFTFPLVIIGLINNYIPYKIPENYVKKIKDQQFHSSLKFVLGMVLFPLYYILISIIAALAIPGSLWSWIYIFFIPFSGFFSYRWFIWFKKIKSKIVFLTGKKFAGSPVNRLIELREEIISIMDHIVYKFNN
jgi:1-acyl-sn-glycerol-3-phosphate acyltransferase